MVTSTMGKTQYLARGSVLSLRVVAIIPFISVPFSWAALLFLENLFLGSSSEGLPNQNHSSAFLLGSKSNLLLAIST